MFSVTFLAVLMISFASPSRAYSESQEMPFIDVTDATDYRDSILWLHQNLILNGYPDGAFRPDACINRAEFLKLLFLMGDQPIDSAQNARFNDVDERAWYTNYVHHAFNRGVIAGYTDGTFRPGQCVNRVEAIKMVVLEFSLGTIDSSVHPQSSEPMNFVDFTGNEWFGVYINAALARQIVGRNHVKEYKGALLFNPGDPMTRKEVAELLYRAKTINDNFLYLFNNDFSPQTKTKFVLAPGLGAEVPFVNKVSEYYPEKNEYVEKVLGTAVIKEKRIAINPLGAHSETVFMVYDFENPPASEIEFINKLIAAEKEEGASFAYEYNIDAYTNRNGYRFTTFYRPSTAIEGYFLEFILRYQDPFGKIHFISFGKIGGLDEKKIRDELSVFAEWIIGIQSSLLEFKEERSYDSEWKQTELTDAHVEKAEVQFDDFNSPSILITFTEEGTRLFAAITARNVNRRLGIFFNGELLSAPIVQQEITGGRASIMGRFTLTEATKLAEDINGAIGH